MHYNKPIIELLKWYIDAGLNTPLEELPTRKTLETLPDAKSVERDGPSPEVKSGGNVTLNKASNPKLASREEQHKNALQAATGAQTLVELRDTLGNFPDCNLRDTAKNLVFGNGNPNADLMLIGEAPGAEEDKQGLPFVGPSGELLDKMLEAIGLSRKSIYITNLIPFRPPGNRSPTSAEVGTFLPFIERKIELIKPKMLVLVGGSSAKALLKTNEGITRLRGKWLQYQMLETGSLIDVRAILHPAYLLRQPATKRETWLDLLAIQEKLGTYK